jgi:cytochrome o ubiquinol oxidase operon protein cyoD
MKDSQLRAYIAGFILSLVFTFIPYYLVVTQTVKGNALLATILSFAVLQMLVQIFFFLHLGRPKMRWQLGFYGATIFAVLVVVLGSIIIITHLHDNMAPKDLTDKITEDEAVHEVGGKQVGTCPGDTGTDHQVIFKNGTITPLVTQGNLCDTITFINEGDAEEMMMFGTPVQSASYAGDTGEDIRSGHNQRITLTEPGSVQFYDHHHPDISGSFTVAP